MKNSGIFKKISSDKYWRKNPKLTILSLLFLSICVLTYKKLTTSTTERDLPVVAIVNYGPHPSLLSSIQGVKELLHDKGYVEKETISYYTTDVNFDTSLIPQAVENAIAKKPRVILTLSTPVSQFAKSKVKDTPIVFLNVTDPVGAGLLSEANSAEGNVTGAADTQDLNFVIESMEKIVPKIKAVGMLYSSSETNDMSLLEMMKEATAKKGIELVALPVSSARDVPMRITALLNTEIKTSPDIEANLISQSKEGGATKSEDREVGLGNRVDFVYVGSSGAIQPALPAIASATNRVKVPIVNVDVNAVMHGQVFASFGADSFKIGMNAGQIVYEILDGAAVSLLPPIYPEKSDFHGYVSYRNAELLQIAIPQDLGAIKVVK